MKLRRSIIIMAVVVILLIVMYFVFMSKPNLLQQADMQVTSKRTFALPASQPTALSKVQESEKAAREDLNDFVYVGNTENKPAEKDQSGDNPVFSEHFYLPMKFENERKLEYIIVISYETQRFHEARLTLLDTVSKYGFLSDCKSYIQEYPYLIANFKIKTENMYQALKEFERIGKLTSESIQAIDHTEEIMILNRKYEREQERIKRKEGAIESKEKTYSDWDSKEYELAGQEDRMDELKMKQWRMEDKLAWASVHFEIKGPMLPPKEKPVDMPQFSNAFNHVIKTLLNFAYALIWISPYILGLAIVIIIWRIIRQRIK